MTAQHPHWGTLSDKVNYRDWDWLRGYIKSHDINQCTDEQGNTLLHHAVRKENRRAFALLSHLLIDPNIKNAAGQTALQLAQDTYPRCLEYLHNSRLCIDFAKASSEPNGLDALFAAIYRGDATLGDTSGVQDDGNEVNAGGWTALHCAAMYDRPHLIRELYQRFPNLDTSLNLSALRLAAKYGHSNCIIALCKCFPAIKAGDALQAACTYNRPACIPTLRECFPQLTGNELTEDYFYSSALMRAAFHNNPQCIRALHSCFPDIDPNLQDSSGSTALIAAAQHPKNSNCIPVLFECFPNLDPNKQDNKGNTALMHACEQRLPQSITSLATYFPSIDVNMRNKESTTALMLAIKFNYDEKFERNGDEKCFMILCDLFPNIDPNIQNWHGYTALMLAVFASNPGPIISQLRKLFPNIDPNIQDDVGRTALMIATYNFHPEPIISQLLKLFPNMDPNKQDEDQNTALILLLRLPVQFVRNFLDTFPNVDVNIQNAQGETAFTIAIEHSKASLVALLLERFPDISFTNSTGRTALMLAIKKKNTDLLSQVLKHISQIE